MSTPARLVAVGLLLLTSCSQSVAPSASPAPDTTTAEVSETGPCSLSDDQAPCVAWRRSGFVAASSWEGVVVAAEADGILKGLDAHNGHILWEDELDSEVVAIASVDGRAYASLQTEAVTEIVVVDLVDGHQLWRHPGSLVDPGRDGAPAVIATEGRVHGVAIDDGSDLWSVDVASAAVGNAFGSRMVVVSQESEIIALDRQSGEQQWRYASSLPIFASVVTGDAVVAQTASGGSVFDGYVILDADDGQVIVGRDDVHNAQVIESDGHLVEVRFGQGARGIDAATGEYTWDIPIGNAFFVGRRAFTLRDRALVMTADQDGREVVALIDPATGQQHWQVRADAHLEQVRLGQRYLSLIRLGGITFHDPDTGEPLLALAVASGVVVGDDPIVIYDGDAVIGVLGPD